MITKFIGIDLGWVSGYSGLCCLGWKQEQLQLLDLTRRLSTEEILEWVEAWVTPTEGALIAVDAPTIITNETGMRLSAPRSGSLRDRLTHQYFRRYHAGCYPANLSRPFAQKTVSFGRSLEKLGFLHAPTIQPQQPGRYQIEVFPHPAIVHFFNLPQILKYKKGNLAQRLSELEKLRQYIIQVLPTHEPYLALSETIDLFSLSLSNVKGIALKAIGDRLDSLICAYVAAHWWYWGQARNWVLGDIETGYIIVPAPLAVTNDQLSQNKKVLNLIIKY